MFNEFCAWEGGRRVFKLIARKSCFKKYKLRCTILQLILRKSFTKPNKKSLIKPRVLHALRVKAFGGSFAQRSQHSVHCRQTLHVNQVTRQSHHRRNVLQRAAAAACDRGLNGAHAALAHDVIGSSEDHTLRRLEGECDMCSSAQNKLMHLIPWRQLRELDLERERLPIDGRAAARDTAACAHVSHTHPAKSAASHTHL